MNLTDRARNLVTDTDARLKQRLGRITFRAWRRGFREADLVLGPFVDQVGPSLDEGELDCLEFLLAEDDDHRLYAWIIGTEPTPAEHDTAVMTKLRTFMRDHVAAAVAEGAG
ncbi:MAG: succinate dehydrogenase assembly factor 2 [Rhodoferax sp.]|uniref:FAD assembly factor SdhE n=1 Tax=Rhodoferax sp. TaxID=50421 RepID=UPI00273006E4|nr:succinate dehydrogenase assembly factor 2 [Rhodoferax sp.]MDP1528541.1 succinate dehydrogenase assembly factor 2 [Rhodoferax sp.]